VCGRHMRHQLIANGIKSAKGLRVQGLKILNHPPCPPDLSPPSQAPTTALQHPTPSTSLGHFCSALSLSPTLRPPPNLQPPDVTTHTRLHTWRR
jgi:hypothetical protein